MKCKALFFLLVMALGIILMFPPQGQCAASADKKVVIGVNQEPSTLDPLLMTGGGDRTTVQNWGEYLIYLAPNGDLEPGLAAAWKFSPDWKEIVFTLRKGVKFHSGDVMTAKDVIFSYDRTLTKNPQGKSRLKTIKSWEAIDDDHVRIVFKNPDVNFIPLCGSTPIGSKAYFDRVGEGKYTREPVGTGPYRVVRYAPGEYVDIERFEDYWGKKPQVKSARFVFVSEDTTRVAKLKAGEVDLISAVPYPLMKEIEGSPGFKIIKCSLNHPTPSVAFGNQNPKTPWYDRRVRLAMAYAIDCDSIIKHLLNGIPNRYAYLAPSELGYDPALKPYPHDPKKAKELLAEAGYPNGFEFSLYYPVGHRTPMLKELGEAIASYFEAVGIKTKLVGEEADSYRARQRAAQRDKAPGAVYVNWGTGGRAGAVDPSNSLFTYFSKDGGYSVYYNPELEKIINEATGTMDDKKRGELVKKGVRIVYEDVASIPVYNNVLLFAMKKNIDFTPTENSKFDIVFVKDIVVK